ncbi:MAG: hypothetical protein H6817_06240 [Phycisphaerales bacterium]|nr:hypothetical protein [Phycisphaerales bacterium]
MSELNLDNALRLAQQMAATAQHFATTDFRNIEARTKADGSDVTDTDQRIERMMADFIRRTFPDHALLAEEDQKQPADMPSPADARYCWVVDPLDGTRNYVRGLPCFSTSIALLDAGTPVVALIRHLVTGATYTAIRGRGAHSGERKLQVAQRPFEPHNVVTFQPASDGRTYDNAAWVRNVHARNFGSTALHLAMLADGNIDASICEQNRMWDIAAGALLVTEAGGMITRIDGSPILPFDLRTNTRSEFAFLAGNAQMHTALLASTKLTPR